MLVFAAVLSGGVKGLLKGLIGSLVRSARRDPHLEVVSRGRLMMAGATYCLTPPHVWM